MTKQVKETYLGDGVYVSHDGHQIRLRTKRGDGDHIIYLEPEVLQALAKYLATQNPTEN